MDCKKLIMELLEGRLADEVKVYHKDMDIIYRIQGVDLSDSGRGNGTIYLDIEEE